jgi:hypothetical protein
LNRRFCGLRSRCGLFGKERNILSQPGFEAEIVQTIAFVNGKEDLLSASRYEYGNKTKISGPEICFISGL